MRTTLVAALVACANTSLKPKARRFLMGLSSDELQFIAEFIGACILESSGQWAGSRAQLAARIAEFQRAKRLGVYGKAKFGTAFKYQLKDLGYDEDLVDELLRTLLIRMSAK